MRPLVVRIVGTDDLYLIHPNPGSRRDGGTTREQG